VQLSAPVPNALPEREPRNIWLMILPVGLAVGILGGIVVMYSIRAGAGYQTMMFPMVGLFSLVGLAVMGRFGRGRKLTWGQKEAARRTYQRDLDVVREDNHTHSRQAFDRNRFVHAPPGELVSVIGSPRMWERRPTGKEAGDFLDVRLGAGIEQVDPGVFNWQNMEIPYDEELEPVSGNTLRKFMFEQSAIRGTGKILSLQSQPGFSVIGDQEKATGLVRAMLCSIATYHSPTDVKIIIVSEDPERWDWAKWLPHNRHNTLVDACGRRRLIFSTPTDLADTLDAELHSKEPERGIWQPPQSDSPTTTNSPLADGDTDQQRSRLMHWVVVDDDTGNETQWQPVTGQRGVQAITFLRIGKRRGEGIGFSAEQTYELADDGALWHTGSAFTTNTDYLSADGAQRVARAMAHWAPGTGHDAAVDSTGNDLARALGGITDFRDMNTEQLWAGRRGLADENWMVFPVGKTRAGEAQYMSLRPRDYRGFGFHGVVIGESGSGKSEFFLSAVIGLACTHSTATANVVFIDMKYESAAQDIIGLPHVLAALSNLNKDDRHLARRMLLTLEGEIARRFRLFTAVKARDANAYEEIRLAGRDDLEPVPMLWVIIDEYLELFAKHPEWIALVEHIAQQGRGANVFVVLGGQRLDLSALSKSSHNFAYRVALRMASAHASRDVLDSNAAKFLPGDENGHALLQVGAKDLQPFRCYFLSAPYVLPKKTKPRSTIEIEFAKPRTLSVQHQPLAGLDEMLAEAAPEEPDEFLYRDENKTVKVRICDVIRESLAAQSPPPPHHFWLPPLEVSEPVDALVARWRGKPWHVDYGDNPGLVMLAGVEDRALEQSQAVHVLDVERENGMVIGTKGTGKTTTALTLITSACLLYRPERVTFFCIGGSEMVKLEGWPHVAQPVDRDDEEGTSRILATVLAALRARSAAFRRYKINMEEYRARRFGSSKGPTDPDDKYGDIFLVIDDFAAFYGRDEGLGEQAIKLADEGPSYGVHVIATDKDWIAGQRNNLKTVANARIELRLSEPGNTVMDREAAKRVLTRPGFGCTADGHELLVGVPEISGADGSRVGVAAAGQIVQAAAGVTQYETVKRLPKQIGLHEIWQTTPRRGSADRTVPFAIGETALQTVSLDLAATPNCLAAGLKECGKSTFLVAMGKTLMDRFALTEMQITVIDPTTRLMGKIDGPHVRSYCYNPDDIAATIENLCRELEDRKPPAGLSQQQLLGWRWSGPRQVVIIDDENLLVARPAQGKFEPPHTPLTKLLPHARDIGLHVLAARHPGMWEATQMTAFIQQMRASRAPILFMDNDGDNCKVMGRIRAQHLDQGRALLLVDETIEGVLVGLPD
jgi:type VII secretion protein EccCa/type VII secretion protein EccCb